jgi:hypothetical protein
MKTQLWMRVCLALLLVLALGVTQASFGQKKPAAPRQVAAALAPPAIDAEYTAKIKEYTTDPCFLTELVDHLPASATVPSPQKVLGYVIGTPEKLTYTKDLYRYYRELAKASPRVRVWSVGTTEEGREFLLVAVSDADNLTNLDRYKQITNKLADPRTITDAEAAQLIRDAKPFYWTSGSIHSSETGSPEMLMELAYRLAVEESPFIQNLRKNLIVLITPVVEVDGHDRMVDLYAYRKANPDKAAPSLVYWGKYVAHDNNRDSMVQSLALSKVMMKVFLDFKPQVLHDLHESVPFLYTSTGTGPYNAWLDPIVINEWQKLAYYEVEEMTKRGVPGVWTQGFYDGWAPNYMFYVANGHNAIGRFYETFGNGGADTRDRTVGAQSQRAWFRPNPPFPRVRWSIRNNINMQQSAILFAMQYTANNKEEFLNNFYLKSKRSVAKATTEGPAAWVILNDGKRPVLAAQLAHLMQRQGAEVHVLDQDTEVKPAQPTAVPRSPRQDVGAQPAAPASGQAVPQKAEEPKMTKLPAGSYVIRMDQPYSRIVDMLLDTQYFNVNDPRPYDDTGWTLGPLRNVATLRVTDTTILKAPMTLAPVPLRFTGSLSGTATKFFVINANAEPALATLRFKLKEVKMFATEDAFEADGKKFNAGAFLIPTEGNSADLRARLEAAAKDLGLRVEATDADIKVERHAIAVPRIAFVHSWLSTQNEGWFRLGLEEWGIPFTYISDQVIRTTPNLKEKFDVILYPAGPGNIASFVFGVRKRMLHDGSDFGGPIPWKESPLMPNVGTSPDQTDDVRGGMGFEGLVNLKKFIEDGGVFIPTTSTTVPVVQLGLFDGISIVETRNLQARGAIFNATVEDKRSPIAYGYDDRLALYFSQSPVFRTGMGGAFFGGGGGPFGAEAAGRPSGRGTLTDPDIPQGRPWNPPTPARPGEAGPGAEFGQQGPQIPQRMTPRVIVRFAAERDLLVSGMLAGGSELAQTPAVVDVPLGRGHVVLFANNPMWRQQTQGSFMLLLNAALHFDNLHVGRRAPAARTAPPADDYDDWDKP